MSLQQTVSFGVDFTQSSQLFTQNDPYQQDEGEVDEGVAEVKREIDEAIEKELQLPMLPGAN
jgi:regulator of sirC expression with transglutaminase-like and TPR domain